MSEKATKAQANYTPEMETRLTEVYLPDATEAERKAQIIELADEFGKNVASVRSKLVRMGLYVKNEYKTKAGEKAETKETIVGQIADTLGVDADAQLSGLEKATKNCLLFLRTTLRVASEISEEGESETS